MPDARYFYKSFACGGALPVPEVSATLTWWLDDGAIINGAVGDDNNTDDDDDDDDDATNANTTTSCPRSAAVVHLLLVNSDESAAQTRTAQSRKMSVELPMAARDLLTCGVTKLARGGHCVSVAWLSMRMEAGCVRLIIQRDSGAVGGTLLMTPEGEMVRANPIGDIASACSCSSSSSCGGGGGGGFVSSLLAVAGGGGGNADNIHRSNTSAMVPFLSGGRNTSFSPSPPTTTGGHDDDDDDSTLPRCGPHTSACVLSEVPTVDAANRWERFDTLQGDFNRRPNPATRPSARGDAVAGLFVVTSGSALWRVKLLESGATSHLAMRDGGTGKEQVGVLCAQLNRAAMEQGYQASAAPGGAVTAGGGGFRHPLYSELGSLQRITRLRRTPPTAAAAAALSESNSGEVDELSFASGVAAAVESVMGGVATTTTPTPLSSSSPQAHRNGAGGWLTRIIGAATGSGGGSGSSSASAAVAGPPKRRYFVVSAVQNTSFFALVRWCGVIEFYDSELEMVGHFPTCYIPPQELAPSSGLFSCDQRSGGGGGGSSALVQQWSCHNPRANAIHVLTCFGTLEGRRCVWSRVPAVSRSTDEKVVLRCSYGLVPPTSGGAPISCSISGGSGGESLTVLWDVGVEEDAHLLSARSISALFNPSLSSSASAPVSAALQVVSGRRGAEGAWVWTGTESYLCHGAGSPRALLAQGGTSDSSGGSSTILIQTAAGVNRAYVLQSTVPSTCSGTAAAPSSSSLSYCAEGTIATLVECVRIDAVDDLDDDNNRAAAAAAYGTHCSPAVLSCAATDSSTSGSGGGAAAALRAPRFVPTTTTTTSPGSSGGSDARPQCQRLFWEGCDALQSCPSGAALLAELLRDSLTAAFSGQQLMPALSRIAHEAYLAGHCPSGGYPFGAEDGEEDDGGVSAAIHAAIDAATSTAANRGLFGLPPATTTTTGSSSSSGQRAPAAAAAREFVSTYEARLAAEHGAVEGLATAAAAATSTTTTAPFCSFSRHYILHSTLRSLLSRVAFLAVTLIGASASGAVHAMLTSGPSTSGNGGRLALVQSIQLLVAAYHAARIAGPDLSHLAPPHVTTATTTTAAGGGGGSGGGAMTNHNSNGSGDHAPPVVVEAQWRPYLSGDEIVSSILATLMFSPTSNNRAIRGHHPATASPSLFAVRVANSFSACRTPRTVRASAAWAAQLQHQFPALTHFRLLVDIDAGRTNRGAHQQDMCMKVVRSIACLAEDLDTIPATTRTSTESEGNHERNAAARALPARCLIDERFLVADAPGVTLLSALIVSPDGCGELRSWVEARPSLAPKLYAVGILRRLIPSANTSSVSAGAWIAAAAAGSSSGGGGGGSAVAAQMQQPQRHAAVPATAVRHYYLTEMMQVRESVVAMNDRSQQQQQRESDAAADSDARSADSQLDYTVPPAAAAPPTTALYRFEGDGGPYASLRTALDELLLDALLYLALAAVAPAAAPADFDVAAAWHDLETALEIAEAMDVLHLYADAFHSVLGRIVDGACAAPAGMDALLTASGTTYAAVSLEEALTVRWYNAIARMPTKSASGATEALRRRAIMGLHRYLCCRHAYAQCGRVMSDLASLLRCSPLRRTTGGSTISIGELAAMALAAAERIAEAPPVVPPTDEVSANVGGGGGGADRMLAASPLSSGFAWRAPRHGTGTGANTRSSSSTTSAAVVAAAGHRRRSLAVGSSPSGIGAVASGGGLYAGTSPSSSSSSALRLLSRDDLPWLRRRVYQSHCERQLWRRGSFLDCTDIWIDGAPAEDYWTGVRRLIEALELAELWEEAYRFAVLAEADAVAVVEHWAVHLSRRTRALQRTTSAAAAVSGNWINSNRSGGGGGGSRNALTAQCDRDDIDDQWQRVIACCGEQSSLRDQFAGFRRAALAALVADYEATSPELRDAHRDADPYTAAATLLRVFTVMRGRLTASQVAAAGRNGNEDEQQEQQQHDDNSSPTDDDNDDDDSTADRSELAARREALSWLPWAHAALICADVLAQAAALRTNGNSSSTADINRNLDVFTAGVVDPLARFAKEVSRVSWDVQEYFAEREGGLRLDAVAAAFLRAVSSV